MSTVTPFLNLVKPAPLEAFSRATYVNNLDLVDAGVQAAVYKTGIPFAHMGRTAAFQSMGGTSTKILFEAAQVLLGGFTFSDADDAVIIPRTGRYTVRIKGFFSGSSSANNQIGLVVNGTMSSSGQYQGPTTSVNKDSTGADIMPHSGGSVTFNQGDKVGLWANSSVSIWGTNGYDGVWLELLWEGTF